MRETAEEITALQELLDRSAEVASEHLRSIMTPERLLPAARVVQDLPSPAVLNVATVTATGEPRLSAVDGHFFHGRWYFTTAYDSPKVRQLAARPQVSASWTPRDGYGLFCHGRAVLLDEGAELAMVRDHFAATYGVSPEEFGTEIAYVRIDPHWMIGFAMTDAEMAQIEADREAREAAR